MEDEGKRFSKKYDIIRPSLYVIALPWRRKLPEITE